MPIQSEQQRSELPARIVAREQELREAIDEIVADLEG